MCNEGCGGSVDILSGIGYCYKTNDLDVVSYKNGRVPWSNSRQQQVQCMCGDQPVGVLLVRMVLTGAVQARMM